MTTKKKKVYPFLAMPVNPIHNYLFWLVRQLGSSTELPKVDFHKTSGSAVLLGIQVPFLSAYLCPLCCSWRPSFPLIMRWCQWMSKSCQHWVHTGRSRRGGLRAGQLSPETSIHSLGMAFKTPLGPGPLVPLLLKGGVKSVLVTWPTLEWRLTAPVPEQGVCEEETRGLLR